MRGFIYKLRLAYWNWVYRDIPDDCCCCGSSMDHYFDNHSPKSMRAWAIEGRMK